MHLWFEILILSRVFEVAFDPSICGGWMENVFNKKMEISWIGECKFQENLFNAVMFYLLFLIAIGLDFFFGGIHCKVVDSLSATRRRSVN